jgi:CDP-diacylglycerol--glycerol-3-phosphate 3-phosphatidyltransferase
MLTIPNIITLARIPLALLFLKEDPFYRCLALALALVSDGLDGYIARRFNLCSKFGALLDPIIDKFFVLFILIILMKENRLSFGEASAMISRDFAVLIFGTYLACMGRLSNYRFRAIWTGKITTFLQLSVLFGLTCGFHLPSYTFSCFVVLGVLALIELYVSDKPERVIAPD